MKNLKNEIYKVKRTRIFFYTLMILTVAFFWATGASMNYLSKIKEGNTNIIITTFTDLNTIFIPIITSVVSMKICAIEHEHQTFKFLKANGIDKVVLYKGKSSFLLLTISIIIIIEAIFIVIMSIVYGLNFEIDNIAKFIIGTIIAGYILNSILLMIALKYKNRALILSVGILGGFIGIVISRLPIFVKSIIPFGIINVLSPVNIQYDRNLGSLVYLDKEGIYAYIVIYFILGIIIHNICTKRLDKEEY